MKPTAIVQHQSVYCVISDWLNKSMLSYLQNLLSAMEAKNRCAQKDRKGFNMNFGVWDFLIN